MEAATKGTFRLAGREFPAKTWYKDKALRKLYITLMFVILTSATNGYDGSMVNGIQSLDTFQNYFNHPSGSLVGLYSCIMYLGSLAALPVAPYIADYWGRRWGIFIGSWIAILGVILQSLSVNFDMFVASRFFLGLGIAISHGSAPLLITELVHPQHRAIFTTVYNTCWYLGAIVAAWLTYGTFMIDNNWSWRIPTIVMCVPSVIQICCVWFVPESPRFLVSRGHEEKALHVLGTSHANGDSNDEVVQIEYHEIVDTLKMEKEVEGNGWLELVKTKGNRHRLIILVTAGLFSQWSGNALVSYYLTGVLDTIGITDEKDQLLINGMLTIWNALVAITMCFFVDKFGRRKLFLISTAGMCICFIFWTAMSARFDSTQNHGFGNAVVAFIYLYYGCYNLAWSGLLVGYTVEILPFNIRAKGMTVMFFFIDVALTFNTYVNPVALNHIGWKYYIVYVCWLLIELLVVWKFYIETKNTPLEEIAKHFDGDAALVGGAAATEKGRILQQELNLDSKGPITHENEV